LLIAVIGGFGSGKSLFLAILGYKLSKLPNYDVYANFHIKGVKYLTPKELIQINPKSKKAVILLDEAYSWLDSRVSASKVNRILSWVVLQSRKRNMDIFYSAQSATTVDLRLRDRTDITIFCRAEGDPLRPSGFTYIMEWINGLRIFRKAMFLPYSKARKYFNIYDTREIVKPIGIQKLVESLE